MHINQLVISLFMSEGAPSCGGCDLLDEKKKKCYIRWQQIQKKDTDNEDEMTKMKPTDLDINKVMLFYYLRKDIPFTRKLANDLSSALQVNKSNAGCTHAQRCQKRK